MPGSSSAKNIAAQNKDLVELADFNTTLNKAKVESSGEQ